MFVTDVIQTSNDEAYRQQQRDADRNWEEDRIRQQEEADRAEMEARYAERDDSVLTRLTEDTRDLNALYELEGATNERLLGEAGVLPGILRALYVGRRTGILHVTKASDRGSLSSRRTWAVRIRSSVRLPFVASANRLLSGRLLQRK